MKRMKWNLLCLALLLILMTNTVNVCASEDYAIPQVKYITYGGIYVITGDGSLWEYDMYEEGKEKILDDIIHIDAGSADMSIIAIGADGTLYSMNTNADDAEFSVTMKNVLDSTSASYQDFVNFAVTKDGKLFSWGPADYEEMGILGTGTFEEVSKPVEILDDVKAVYASDLNAVALKTDGTLWRWGVGQATPVKATDNVVSVESITGDRILALKENNSLWLGEYRFKDGKNAFYYEPSFEINVKSAAVTDNKFAFVKTDGTLYIGVKENNSNGGWSMSTVEVADGVKEVILPKELNNMTEIPFGFIKEDDSLWVSGSFVNVAYDNGKNEPEKILDNVEAVSMTENGGAAITNDGSLYRWGFAETGNGWNNVYSVSDITKIDRIAEIEPSSWAKDSVDRAIGLEIVPKNMRKDYKMNISRVDFCEMLTKTIEAKTGKPIEEFLEIKDLKDAKSFIDTSSKYVEYMSRLGIVNGVGENLFDPYGKITREQAAIMLMRTAAVLGYDTSATKAVEANVSSWAKDGVAFVTEAGIMNGTGNGFEPQGKYTKEQAIITFVRMIDNLK